METNSQQLFVQLYVPIVSFIEEIIDDHEYALDIAIEVFKRNIAELENYDGSVDLTEITQVLQRKALIESFLFLRRRNESQEALETFLESNADYEASVEETLIVKEMYQALDKTESMLSKCRRQAMRLFFLEVQTAEAASMMKISESTYRCTKHNAIKKYRLALKIGGFLIIAILLSISAKAH